MHRRSGETQKPLRDLPGRTAKVLVDAATSVIRPFPQTPFREVCFGGLVLALGIEH